MEHEVRLAEGMEIMVKDGLVILLQQRNEKVPLEKEVDLETQNTETGPVQRNRTRRRADTRKLLLKNIKRTEI